MNVFLTQRLGDLSREWRIAWCGFRLLRARQRERQAFYWRRMAAEIGARSPHQVARMEAARGLSQAPRSPQ